MKLQKRTEGFSLVMVLVVLLIIAGVGGAAYMLIKDKDEPKNVRQAVAGPIGTELKNEGAVPNGWKAYKDPNYQFGFSYPEKWAFSTGTFEKNQSADGAIFFISVSDTNNTEANGGYSVRVLDKPLADVIKDEKGGNSPKEAVPIDWIGKEAKIKKGNYSGMKLTTSLQTFSDPPSTFTTSVYLFSVGDEVYKVSPIIEEDSQNPGNSEESEKFIDAFVLY